jgi:hypothetical protein
LALAIPIAIITYVFIRIIGVIELLIKPIATKFGIDKFFGELTLSLIAVFLILICITFLGYLMRIAAVSKIQKEIESVILNILPSLNYLKVMENDFVKLENNQNAWSPVLLFNENKYCPAFIIEEDDNLITLFICKGTGLKEGEILTTYKEEVKLIPTTITELFKCSKDYGKGYLGIIKNAKMNYKNYSNFGESA